ncbi:MAG: ribosome recycling factor [Peptoniphilaceae bacterium]|uniref:ribosome recycling factor n=1 Tax=Parvimonas sp. TaxID=1944660 RepID=UPI0025EF7845|nr:ribosome recycling factor [Parvimonas sp.]MCI5997789.1 ribosome recycling factor [Parvimonas sp.]MDD7765286.1 ribosome recycling factor [Peptoniphilaceae bacterium]MDY3050898.1 ribosome recycling factor [Parvimonas sp.]
MYKEVINELERKMKKSIEAYEEELLTVRAGRANPNVLDQLSVDYYGTDTPIKQVASISVPEARLLVIQPWDASLIGPIEKVILKSNLGITPSNDGKVIRLPFPALTEDRRKELVKVVKGYSENAKVALRNLRRDSLDKLKKMEKDKQISEDELRVAEEDVQKVIDKFTKDIEDINKKKEKELMEI